MRTLQSIGVPLATSNAGASPKNYFGNGSDGALNTTGNTTLNVLNRNGSYDGDMVVRQYTNLTINSGHTLTTDYPCRGLLLLVQGDVVLNGVIDMSNRGARAYPNDSSSTGSQPTQSFSWGSAGSDGNLSGGIAFSMLAPGATASAINSRAGFYGCGTAAVNAMTNMVPYGTSGCANFYIPPFTARGGKGFARGTPANGFAGESIPSFSSNGEYWIYTGGGGAGATSQSITNAHDGAFGSCWSGGSGGRGTHNAETNENGMGGRYGGPAGGQTQNYGGDGGAAGNPGSPASTWGAAGDTGTGGIIILVCGGTLSGSGLIRSTGSRAGVFVTNTNSGGGSAGGGAAILLAVTNSYSGSYDMAGGITAGAEPGLGASGNTRYGGAGGAGSVRIMTVSPA